MPNRIDFLVIGAQKCATSWLYYCLKEHPDLRLPDKKREIEYLGGDLYEARGAEWYFGLLGHSEAHQKRGAVSVEYLFDARSPAIVHQCASAVKLIVSLREPIDRAISAYYWVMRRGLIPNLPIGEGLARSVGEWGAPENQKTETRRRYADIIQRGFYDIQLERYLHYFQPEQFLFLLYEDIQRAPREVIQEVYAFIGVDPDFVPNSINEKPKQNLYLSPLIHMERLLKPLKGSAKLIDLSSQFLYKLGVWSRRPTLPNDLLKKLHLLYHPHNEQTQRIINQAPVRQRPFSGDILSTWTRNWH
jgi:hypothetical protein